VKRNQDDPFSRRGSHWAGAAKQGSADA